VPLSATGILRGNCWGGGACMLIARHVLTKLNAPWFRHYIVGEHETPEDVGLCQYVRDNRGTIALDCDIRPIHHQMEECRMSQKQKAAPAPKQISLGDATVEQLKAAAYDCVAIIEQAQARLRQINAAIAEKLQKKQ
jgi:hypothetical protein